MIITDITMIDRLAEEAIAAKNEFVSIDMGDYLRIKECSASLAAVKVTLSELSESTIEVLRQPLEEMCQGGECNILMHVGGKDILAGKMAISYEQMQMLMQLVEASASHRASIIWGMGELNTSEEGITILIIVGKGK